MYIKKKLSAPLAITNLSLLVLDVGGHPGGHGKERYSLPTAYPRPPWPSPGGAGGGRGSASRLSMLPLAGKILSGIIRLQKNYKAVSVCCISSVVTFEIVANFR